MNCPYPRLFALVSLALAMVLPAAAQAPTGGTGTITGHVYNAANKEYVRNADVHVEGTNITVPTESGGYFSLAHVPAGAVTVTVTYAGLPPVTTQLTVAPDETVTHEFELGAVQAAAETADSKVVQLDAYMVTSVKDGNAKALQLQKNSMNLSRSVASDAFGNVTEGNVGEFLKYLPGVELEYVEADTRGPRIGGMSSEYASVTIDGKSIASADSFGQYVGFENSGSGTANRSFGFDSISINSIEAIEINRITSAAMDANAPAGNINLITKKAFDLKGRDVRWSLSTVLNSEEFRYNRSRGPDDSKGVKYRPNYSLNYSDIFFNNRLGVVISVQESNLYNEQYRVDHTYNRTPTATDLRPQVLTAVLFKDGPKWTERGSYTAVMDFKASPNLTFSLATLFSRYHAQFYNRQVTMQAATNNVVATTGRQFVTGDGMLTFGTGGATPATNAVIFGGGNGDKFTNTLTFVPSFQYRRGDITVNGSFTSSHSRNDYDNLAHGTTANSTVNNLTGVGFTAIRSSSDGADWKVTQTGGGDWANLALQLNPRISDDNRKNTIDIKAGDLDVKYALPVKLPSFLQFGGKRIRNAQFASNSNDSDKWLFVGPGGGTTGSFGNYPSPFVIFQGSNQPHVQFTSISGLGAPAFPDRDTLGTLFNTHPEYFTRTLPTSSTVASTSGISLANYESGLYLNQPTYDITETVTAGYLMGNTRIAKLQLQGGVRYELTELESTQLDPYSNKQVAAAGYPMTAPVAPATVGVPNSTAAIDYKYSRPRVGTRGEYHDLFPSITAKYTFTRNLLGDLGWGKSIRRPDLSRISGARQVNEDAGEITTPNPNLLPERAQKLAASLSYFFGRNAINNVQVVASRTRVTGKTVQGRLTAEEYGNTDPTYDLFTFVSYGNAPAPVTYNSMEFSYQQYLNFLPGILQGTSITTAYTHTYVSIEPNPPVLGVLPPPTVVLGVIPNTLKTSLNYRLNRFSLIFSAIWQDDSGPYQAANRYQKANTKCDLSGSFRINDRLSVYFAGRNVFEQSHRLMEVSPGNTDVLFRYENYGTNWTFGLKGNF